jgi:2-dehydro-3-deoxyphosphooctonate aldolase (KDO 8-P synthase)
MQIDANENQPQILTGSSLTLIAGPCVIESDTSAHQIAARLKDLAGRLELPFIFKASFDKANRSSLTSYRGPGMDEGLRILADIKTDLSIPVLSDVHDISQIEAAASVLDVLQIPAFLCRQTDLLLAAARSGKTVNIKKGQFLAPWDISNIIDKVTSVGNRQILLTERGVMFGYNNLVVDFRSIAIMRATGFPVIFDATHSVQLPGGQGQQSGGQRQYAPLLARAAVAAGADGIFLEVHPQPDEALCDGPNSLPLEGLDGLLRQLMQIHHAVSGDDEKE